MASDKTTDLHYANDTNSTKFTDCCGLAVLENENLCPGCKAPIRGRQSDGE